MMCDKCKFADWNRTKTGRLHPDKQGRCRWTITVQLPPSASAWEWRKLHDGGVIISGGHVERGHELKRDCPYYEVTP